MENNVLQRCLHTQSNARPYLVFNAVADVDYCGQLPLTLGFTVEAKYPAKFYQTCLPQVFRYLNTVTNNDDEIFAIVNGTLPTTDHWETIHIQTAIGSYELEKKLLQSFGFGSVVTGDELGALYDLGDYDHPFGYFDEHSLKFLWEYVDYARARVPKNRLYLGWMSTTTHTPLRLPPTMDVKSYVHDSSEGDSMNRWLNAVRWTDDAIKEIILGFRDRGLENETLFVMYCSLYVRLMKSWRPWIPVYR